LASIGLLVLYLQGGIGLELARAAALRRTHVAGAIVLALLLAGHVALNRIG